MFCDNASVTAQYCTVTGGNYACYQCLNNGIMNANGAHARGGLNGFQATWHSTIILLGSDAENNVNWGFSCGGTSYVNIGGSLASGNGLGGANLKVNTLQSDGSFIQA